MRMSASAVPPSAISGTIAAMIRRQFMIIWPPCPSSEKAAASSASFRRPLPGCKYRQLTTKKSGALSGHLERRNRGLGVTPRLSNPPPARPLRPILQHHAGRRQLVADAVGAGEVLGFAGGDALGDQGFD